tara:strand:+ start:579 stop:1466 length:888 start_codon:yes stop_codon:yes gene_type:complete
MKKVTRASGWGERLIETLLLSCGLVTVLTTIGIGYILLSESLVFFKDVSLMQFFGDTQWTPLFADKHFGIWPLVMGTLLTAGVAMAVALPCGLAAAIYLRELASPKLRQWLKPSLEMLAGIPTIVYGYFALLFVTPLLQEFLPNLSGFNALSPGIVMGFMITPMIASLSEDALSAVSNDLREGAYALGAGRASTIFRVILPAARSGIAAASLLALARAVGETMIVAIAAGQQPRFTFDPQVPVETMTAYIVQVSMGDTPQGTLEYQTIFAVGLTLFAMTFIVNIFGQRLARGKRS